MLSKGNYSGKKKKQELKTNRIKKQEKNEHDNKAEEIEREKQYQQYQRQSDSVNSRQRNPVSPDFFNSSIESAALLPLPSPLCVSVAHAASANVSGRLPIYYTDMP